MKRGGGKSKGANFERDICKKLSLWISKGEREDLFWRSAMSGGRATVGAKKGKDLRHQAGDITAVHPSGHVLTDKFYIECKHYRDLQLDKFVVCGLGRLAKFWETTREEALQHGRRPMLIAKQNNMPTIVLVEGGNVSVFGDPILITRFDEAYRFDALVKYAYSPNC